LYASLSKVWQSKHPFHVSGVGEIDPHVIGYFGKADAEARGNKGLAAFAFLHRGGTSDFQHHLVFTGLQNTRRDDDLERPSCLILADFLTVDERCCTVGNAIPPQDRQALRLKCRDSEVPAYPNKLRIVRRFLAPLHERPRQADSLPRDRSLSFRRLSMLV